MYTEYSCISVYIQCFLMVMVTNRDVCLTGKVFRHHRNYPRYLCVNVCSLLCNAVQGEIRATAFNDTAERFYPQFEVDKVYYISKCQVKNANKQYSSLKNDYEMTFRDETEVEEVCTYCTYMCCYNLHIS